MNNIQDNTFQGETDLGVKHANVNHEYGTFEIRRNDPLSLTSTHCSHVILRNCRALLYYASLEPSRQNLNEEEFGR